MPITLKIDDELKEEEILWRYMDLAKLVSMLEQNALWLARVDTFKDQHEGRFPDEMRKLMEKAYEEFGDNNLSPVKDANDFQDYLVKNTFVSCWHKNSGENMVMWLIYGQDTNSVAIQTTIKKIKEYTNTASLNGHSLILKNVKYKKSEEITNILPYEECFFIKRPHFSFEEEVRISLDTYSHETPSKNTPYGYKLHAQMNNLINAIFVHPDCSNWFLDVVKSIVEKYNTNVQVLRGTHGTK